LSRFVLPFDSETDVKEQGNFKKSGWSVENTEFAGKITDRDLNYLVKGANSMRRLVRVKVADSNDLETAASALRLTVDFLKKMMEKTKDDGGAEDDAYKYYKALREGKVEEGDAVVGKE
jgi:hypothetical protein